MPVRTTRDYNAPAVSPLLKAVLDDALQEEEEDLDIDASIFQLDQSAKASRRERSHRSRSKSGRPHHDGRSSDEVEGAAA
ncbi:unnamed protein product, partial [Ixodes pacificus]